MHNNSNMRNKQMVINACKILPFFQNFADSCLQDDPFLLISRIRDVYFDVIVTLLLHYVSAGLPWLLVSLIIVHRL